MSLSLPIYATLALGAGPWLFLRAFRDFRVRRLIQNTPTARIRSMAMGLVEVNGQIVQRSEHLAPFSGQACAYWQVDISTRGRNNSWTVVHRNASGSPFFVRDDTGLALVYPKGAECRVQHQVEETCLGISLPDCYVHYMDDERLAFRHVWRLSTLRFRERRLDEGQNVYVLGTAVPRSQVMTVSQDEQLAATGTDGPHERRIRELQHDAVAIVRLGENEKVFIISQQSERDLTLMLALRAWAGMLGGPVLTLFGLGYWLQVLANQGRFPG
jgi:E3 ubiquitin ligase